MKIKLFIVTYNNSEHLNQTLESLNCDRYDVDITIINNHSNFSIDSKFKDIKVLHNMVRPNFSTGHLARNWNQAIINGFKDMDRPDADVLIHSQDDVIFAPNFFTKLEEFHKCYSFITFGWGDTVCSYLPEAVRKIGLWDERFCNIGYQEADYFLRALMFNKDKSSINDIRHGRVINFIPLASALVKIPPKNVCRETDHAVSTMNHRYSLAVFLEKYCITPERWSEELRKNPPTTFKTRNYIMYPYFESKLDLSGKNYVGIDNKQGILKKSQGGNAWGWKK